MPPFDLDRFLQLSGAVPVADLPWQQAAEDGLTDAEARILRYMADTETHTILYLRDLLAGHSCHDPEVTSFLSVWVYEELWHGRALDQLLTACGRPPPKEQFATASKQVSWREPLEAAASHLLASATPRFVAVHMAWGAINELSAAAAYKQLAQQSQNRVLRTLLGRIAKQERKHFAFYYQQAKKRLEGDAWAQRLCRSVLQLAWTPVGSGVGGELPLVAHTLFREPAGRALLADIDATIGELPGLEGFDLVSRRVGAIVTAAEGGEANRRGASRSNGPAGRAKGLVAAARRLKGGDVAQAAEVALARPLAALQAAHSRWAQRAPSVAEPAG